MSNTLLKQQVESTQDLRRAAGIWLRTQRETQSLSQTELAKKLGLEYYTFISQIENGRGKIPPHRYEDWAIALGVPTRDFALRMMQYYDPITYGLIFEASAS